MEWLLASGRASQGRRAPCVASRADTAQGRPTGWQKKVLGVGLPGRCAWGSAGATGAGASGKATSPAVRRSKLKAGRS